jgi:hypothetical protein
VAEELLPACQVVEVEEVVVVEVVAAGEMVEAGEVVEAELALPGRYEARADPSPV